MAKKSEAFTAETSGVERTEIPKGITTSPTSDAEMLTPDAFRHIGETLGGHTHWQADIARRLRYSKSLITRFLNGSRVVRPEVSRELRLAIIEKIDELADLLKTPGLTFSEQRMTEEASYAIKLITASLKEMDRPEQ